MEELFTPKFEPPTLTPITHEEMVRIRLETLEARTREVEYIAWGLLGFLLIVWLIGRR